VPPGDDIDHVDETEINDLDRSLLQDFPDGGFPYGFSRFLTPARYVPSAFPGGTASLDKQDLNPSGGNTENDATDAYFGLNDGGHCG